MESKGNPSKMQTVLNGRMFTWTGNHGCCDVSDLNDHPQPEMRNFVVESHKTGHMVAFRLISTEVDWEEDILSWEYQSPCGKFSISIFND